MMVAGFGVRKEVALDAVAEALSLAVERCGIDLAQIEALATAADKQGESALKT